MSRNNTAGNSPGQTNARDRRRCRRNHRFIFSSYPFARYFRTLVTSVEPEKVGGLGFSVATKSLINDDPRPVWTSLKHPHSVLIHSITLFWYGASFAENESNDGALVPNESDWECCRFRHRHRTGGVVGAGADDLPPHYAP